MTETAMTCANITPEQVTVVLLAAGHGKRMRPLTTHTPKPLLKVGEHTLIEHHLMSISSQGFRNVVINIAHLAAQFEPVLGDGEKYGLHISYSDESDSGALETAGALVKALPLIKSDPFITINADIWTDYKVSQLLQDIPQYAKLVMVVNPEHNPKGDFELSDDGFLIDTPNESTLKPLSKLTYSGMAIYRKHILANLGQGKQALAPIFRQLIAQRRLTGTKLIGEWRDIGTPERLEELRKDYFSSHSSGC